jgi:hypothetical protein
MFAQELQKKGYKIVILNPGQESSLRGQQVAADAINGFYENEFLNQLPQQFHLIECHNTLLGHDQVDFKHLKPKFSFSFFRKKYESIALKADPHFLLAEPPQIMVPFLSYLDSKKASVYFQTRNAFTGIDFSTRLSHLLNLGQISPKTILSLVEKYEQDNGQNKSTYWIKFELLWREYFYWLSRYHQKDFFRSNGLNGGDLKLEKIPIVKYIEQMNTHPLIKAMNNELISTGYLSNRSRQIYVSYLVHKTSLDWRYGAWFFQHYLLDYDLNSNWGNWLYGSGYGTDARGPRYFDIKKQLNTYDPDNLYLKKWST